MNGWVEGLALARPGLTPYPPKDIQELLGHHLNALNQGYRGLQHERVRG